MCLRSLAITRPTWRRLHFTTAVKLHYLPSESEEHLALHIMREQASFTVWLGFLHCVAGLHSQLWEPCG